MRLDAPRPRRYALALAALGGRRGDLAWGLRKLSVGNRSGARAPGGATALDAAVGATGSADDWVVSGRWSAAFALALLLHLPFLRLAVFTHTADAQQWLAGPGRGAGSEAVSVYEVYLVAGKSRAVPPVDDGIVRPEVAAAVRDAGHAETKKETAADRQPASDLREQGGGGRDSYYARLRAHLQRHRRPIDAEPEGARTVVVRFRVDRAGGVSSIGLQLASGDPRLDAEAIDLVRRAAPMPPPPRQHALNLSVPIEFE